MLKTITYRFLLLTVAFAVVACGQPTDTGETTAPTGTAAPAEAPPAEAPDLATLLASESRSADDRARDAGRKPAEVIAFLGIEPGMTVIDLIAAGGYYTEVLSLATGPEGRVVAQNPPRVLEMRDGANDKALTARLANNRLPNVTRKDSEVGDISTADGPFDAALTALNFHDIYNGMGEEAAVGAFTVVYNALKPGGVFGVIDHLGAEGNDNASLHRALKSDAIRVAEAAGFVVDGDSGILHVHSDDMTLGVFDEQVRGKTHRFLLRLKKPG